MSSHILDIEQRLEERKQKGLGRILRNLGGGIDFCSNDYLGLARSQAVKRRVIKALEEQTIIGGSGSRLVSGDNSYYHQLEDFIARYHRAESALIFNSGYTANLSLFSTLPRRADTVLYDQAVHASIRDGIRLGTAKSFSFRHNDISDLLKKAENATGQVYIVTESVFSMDGDLAPLSDLSELVKERGFRLVVDEAHAVGVFGPGGSGRVVAEGLEDFVFARIITFGKALGAFGAAVLGSEILREWLINSARPFIYTTALSLPALAHIEAAYQELKSREDLRERLTALIAFFKKRAKESSLPLIANDSAIQQLRVSGNQNVLDLADALIGCGFDVRAYRSPTVPAGTERIRICLHAFNKEEQVNELIMRAEDYLSRA
ncbi:MAG: 8-amino-7-oxononanoate synthase [Candidatus Dadabacteria bacterium]|nr:MAG: 8-amino-7-oxononanoate synthase [Candidatus Dadabacteria bacterium]